MLIQNRDGHRLLELLAGDESLLSAHRPLTHALVVARHADCTLLVHNKHRLYWELPGGLIDPGESARAAASRELREETCQQCDETSLTFRAVMKFQLRPGNTDENSKIEFGALYTCEPESRQPFKENDEVSRIHWWDGSERIGEIDDIDRELSGLAPTLGAQPAPRETPKPNL